MTPQEEATILFRDIISELTSQTRDLKSVLRKCQHACHLIQWEEAELWFQRELRGYDSSGEIPAYRKIRGKLIWRAQGSTYDLIRWKAAEVVGDSEPHETLEAVLDVWSGVDWLISAAESGYSEITGETKQACAPGESKVITWERARVFRPHAFGAALSEIEAMVFDFVSKAYVQLEYGNAIGDLWTRYRTSVDAALQKLGMTEHLSAIQKGLRSNNSEEWRLSASECRNLLNDVANYLWKDPRTTYEYLPGKGDGGKLEVNQNKFNNRLSAYLHQKSITGTRGHFLRAELERLADSIKALINFQNEAHNPMRIEDVRSVAIATYVLIGEIAIKTDLEPVHQYVAPSNQLD